MPVLLIALVVLALTALIVYAVQRHGEKVSGGWQQAAERLGAHFNPKHGPWYRRTRLIEGKLHGQRVSIDHYTVSTGQSSVTYTRCTSGVDFAGGFELKVYPKGVFSKVGEALGTQDVKTGDAAFDEAYMVKANDEDRARAWLTPEVRQAITRMGDYRFTLKNSKLTAEYGRLESDPDTLERLGRCTAAVAHRGQQLREFWMGEAATLEATVEELGADRLRIAVEGDSVPLRIETKSLERAGGETRIIARRMSPDGERFALRPRGEEGLAIDSDAPEVTRRRISPALDRRIAALGPVRIEADGEELVVVAKGIEGDRERLAEAMAVAEELAAADPRVGYR